MNWRRVDVGNNIHFYIYENDIKNNDFLALCFSGSEDSLVVKCFGIAIKKGISIDSDLLMLIPGVSGFLYMEDSVKNTPQNIAKSFNQIIRNIKMHSKYYSYSSLWIHNSRYLAKYFICQDDGGGTRARTTIMLKDSDLIPSFDASEV